MKNLLFLACALTFAASAQAQEAIPVGKGSYASYPPAAVEFDDGYFANRYSWFRQAYPLLNLHDNARNRPLPTNSWWTEFLFRGLGREEVKVGDEVTAVTVTADGSRFGSEAWALPAMMTATSGGFNVYFPKGFNGGGMNRGLPLSVGASAELQAADANTLFADFESAGFPVGWTATNNTQNIAGPMATGEVTQNPRPEGYTGSRFVNTFKGDNAQLTLASPAFTIEKRYIRLRVGGGNHPDAAYVGLFVDGVRVRSETGQNNATLTQRTWDVGEYAGRQAEIRIVDATAAGWGFILCDEIVFTDSPLGGAGYTADFQTDAAKVYSWSDLGFTLRSGSGGGHIDATLVHGVPFAYFEMSNLHPIITPNDAARVYDASGAEVTDFPATLSAFALEFDGRVFGVHVAAGSRLHRSRGGDFQVEAPPEKSYVVISVLPARSLLAAYDACARSKPGSTEFRYDYKVSEGRVEVTFALKPQSMETGVAAQTMMCFLPHHYRSTANSFEWTSGADYSTFLGTLRTSVDSTFTFSYSFGGMPPYLPEPLDMAEERSAMMQDLLDRTVAQAGGRNGNTYAKGLGEQANAMLFARAVGHAGFDRIKAALREELTDWLTFSTAERTQKGYYFAQYPDYGALIGFPPGYGSQGFNDLHFHYGYFAAGAARLMMVDDDFKSGFAEMAKKVAETYACWTRYTGAGSYQPFLRTFDPYLGHSFAGGTGDGGGNNQESTSEALNSWFGLFLLGVELGDSEIISAAAAGYVMERTATEEYWLDLYDENFPDTYNHEYAGIVRTDNVAWATYFSGDPAWVLGIQACPVDFFYTEFAKNPQKMAAISAAMLGERTPENAENYPGNDDARSSYKAMGPYLGGYHLNILSYINPDTAAEWLHSYCNDAAVGGEWRSHINTLTAYFQSNAMRSYGLPAEGYHTSIPSGAVYKNSRGELTCLLYNPADRPVDVQIYKDGSVVETVSVAARKFYNSRVAAGYRPTVAFASHAENARMELNNPSKVVAAAFDRDGAIRCVEFYFDGDSVGCDCAEPYEASVTPRAAGAALLQAVAVDSEGLRSDTATLTVEVFAQSPFKGTPWMLPAQTIYAVQFDEGGEGISCHDNTPVMEGGDKYREGTGVETENTGSISASNIGWTNPGEWWEYTVDIAEAGVYAMSARLGGQGSLRIFVDEVDVSGERRVQPTGGWEQKNVTVGVFPLPAGRHVLRVMLASGGINLSSYTFKKQPAVPITVDVPYVQYLTVNLSPSDTLGKDRTYRMSDGLMLTAPGSAGATRLTVQNAAYVAGFVYYEGTPVTLSVSDFRGNYDVSFWALPKQGTDTIKGIPFTADVYKDMVIHVRLTEKTFTGNLPPAANAGLDLVVYAPVSSVTLNGSGSADVGGEIVSYRWEQLSGREVEFSAPDSAVTLAKNLSIGDYRFRLTVTDDSAATSSDDVLVRVLPPEQVDFLLSSPADSGMVTDTRRPTLTWNACSGATGYEVYLNISRDDYEWYASGNLLDRYTKVGETSLPAFTLQSDLPDRWTYKWYVVALTPQGQKFSDRRRFGLYIPALETEDDGVGVVDGYRDMNKNGTIEPFENWRLTPEQRLEDVMSRLTRDEKIAQLFYGGDAAPYTDGFAFSYGVEGGMRDVQRRAAQTRMGIPVGFFGDKVHGWKTIYPTQLGIAATRDPHLAYLCGNMHRLEQKGFGFTGTLAPLAEVDTKVLYPRFQEGNGENADEASAMVRAMVCGMQGGPELNPHSMVTTVKHWPAQGAGGESALQYDAATIGYHLKPWIASVEANAASVMPGYNTAPYIDPTGKGANSSKPIIDYLRNEIGFKGFVITDWLAANTAQSIESVSVGINVLGGAPSAPTDFDELVEAVGMEKIEESVRRVLDVKIRTGMFDNPYADASCVWTGEEHHSIALEAARKSITLLKNNGVLPLQPVTGDKIAVGGARAVWVNERGEHSQIDDPNVIWQSIYYDNPRAKTYLQAIADRAAQSGMEVENHTASAPNGGAGVAIGGSTKTAVVVIGEKAYTHGTEWEDKNPNIPEAQMQDILRFKSAGLKVIVVVILPRPYVLTEVVEAADAVMVVYRGGNGIAQATAECIFGDFSPSGKLPFQLPRSQDQLGSDSESNQVERWELPYDIGASETERALIRSAMEQDVSIPPIYGDPLFQYGFGLCYGCSPDDNPPVGCDTCTDNLPAEKNPIGEFSLLSPADGSAFSESSVLFEWQVPSLDTAAALAYLLYVDDTPLGEVAEASCRVGRLAEGYHTWYVKAVAGARSRKSSATFGFTSGVSQSPTGLGGVEAASVFARPNPVVDGWLTLSYENLTHGDRVEIYDVTGALVHTASIDRNLGEQAINIAHLPPGIYLVKVGNASAKVLKQ
ncbi:MAG: glycoside hydrolase family 3 C-terminal domain-containing protein [Prevotellaceae bacterium]|jgi:beta-glucosidase-like glycosyl hydrolase|nr:glycoside hydrolase family 3 C-terminal domain-containing protein [Prevotellaceae bacterium]